MKKITIKSLVIIFLTIVGLLTPNIASAQALPSKKKQTTTHTKSKSNKTSKKTLQSSSANSATPAVTTTPKENPKTSQETVVKSNESKSQNQTRTIYGTVIDALDGKPIIGAFVSIKVNGQSTTTNYKGGFYLEVPNSALKSSISHVGHKSKEVYLYDNMIVKLERDANNYSQKTSNSSGNSSSYQTNNNSSEIDNYIYRARSGDPYAQYYLGCCYAEGYMVKRNLSEARYWFHRAENNPNGGEFAQKSHKALMSLPLK